MIPTRRHLLPLLAALLLTASAAPSGGHVARPNDLAPAGVILLSSPSSPASPPEVLLSTRTQVPVSPAPDDSDANWMLPDVGHDLGLRVLHATAFFDASGCPVASGFEPPPVPPPSSPPWAALVPRGRCTFAEKIRSAKRAGASAVIIGNTLEALYGKAGTNRSSLLSDPCSLDCDLGEAMLRPQ